jgi:hypothetical protein
MKEKSCTYFKGLMTEVLFGNDADAEKTRPALQEHMAECPGCAAEYREMAALLTVTAKRRRPEMGEDYWDSYMVTLREKMELRESQKMNPFRYLLKRARDAMDFLREDPLATGGKIRRWVLYPAAALVLIFVGIAIGRHLYPPPGKGEPGGTFIAAERMITPAVSEHFENLRPLLIDYANASLPEKGTEEKEWVTLDQELLKQLLFQNYLLKKMVARKNDVSLEQLLSSLEMVLLEISNSKGNETARRVREILKYNDILFKMKVYNTNRSKPLSSL